MSKAMLEQVYETVKSLGGDGANVCDDAFKKMVTHLQSMQPFSNSPDDQWPPISKIMYRGVAVEPDPSLNDGQVVVSGVKVIDNGRVMWGCHANI